MVWLYFLDPSIPPYQGLPYARPVMKIAGSANQAKILTLFIVTRRNYIEQIAKSSLLTVITKSVIFKTLHDGK